MTGIAVSVKTSNTKRNRGITAVTAEHDTSLNLKFSPGLLLVFVICSLSLFVFSIQLPESAFDWLNESTARMAACCLNQVGMHPVLYGHTLSQDGFALSVITECSTLYMALLFFSFVVAYPTALRHKFTGLPLGIAVLHAGNILRIAALFALGVKIPGSFEFVHVYLGQVLMVLFVLAVCLAWLNMWSEPSTRKHELFIFFIRFLAFTSILFLLWLPLNRGYIKLADHVVTGLFSLFRYRFAMKHQHAVYYQAFNVVTFTGLVLATRIKPQSCKIWMLAAGQAAIFILHILFRISNAWLAAFQNGQAERFGDGIAVCGQYILPVAFWLLMVRKAVKPVASGKRRKAGGKPDPEPRRYPRRRTSGKPHREVPATISKPPDVFHIFAKYTSSLSQ
jgi:exosortase H (IPTLxxWG-CTERM-specific)